MAIWPVSCISLGDDVNLDVADALRGRLVDPRGPAGGGVRVVGDDNDAS